MANLAALMKKASEDARRKAQEDARRKAQEDARRKVQAEAASAAAVKKAQEEAAKKAQQQSASTTALRKAQSGSISNVISAAARNPQTNVISAVAAKNPQIPKNIPASISTVGSEIQKQKEQVENNLKLLTSAAIAGTGLIAGGLSSLANSSKDKKDKQPFSKENRTSVTNMYVIMPDANTNKKYIKNPNYKQFVNDYGCQIVPFKFYNKGAELTEYEKFFNDNKSACIPMALAIDYFRKRQNDEE